MAPQGPPREAATAANVEQPAATTPSPDQVQLQQDGRKDSSGARLFRLLFRGKTVFEHRCSGHCPCLEASSSTGLRSSSSSSSSSGDDNCPHPQPPPGPVAPDWVMALASRCRAEREGEGPVVDLALQVQPPRFLMTKKVTKTDLNSDENRLLVPAAFVNSNILPLLSDDEQMAASLDGYASKKRKRGEEMQSAPAPPVPPEVEEGSREVAPSKKKGKTMEKGRQHGGLQVTAWSRSLWHFDALRLTCWDRNKGTMLKGEHLKYLYDRSFLREGDQVELWGFRDVASCTWRCTNPPPPLLLLLLN